MDAVRVAIIGCGKIAEKHVASLTELGGEAVLTGLYDLNAERLKSFTETVRKTAFPDAAGFATVEELLAHAGADLVVVASSSDSHASLALQALRAGKHVLVEKPLALSMEEARGVTDEATGRGLVAAVSFQARYLPQMLAVKKAAEQGRFGAIGHGVVSMRWRRPLDYYKESPWRESWSKGGGLFMNQCIHYIDLLQWILGPVRSVYARAAASGQDIGVENTGAAVLTFKNGAIGMIEASTHVYPSSLGTSLGVFGERGSVLLGGALLDDISVWKFEASSEADRGIPQPQAGGISHTPLYRDLISAIRTGSVPLTAAVSSLATHEIVLALYRSIASGKTVELPLQTFTMSKMAWME